MKYNELIGLWEYAFQMLYENDMALFDTDVQERAIAGRLAIYLQYGYDKHFEKDACIDLEYNRDGTGIKRPHPRDDDGWIAPDILLHVRKTDINIFYCEVKKKSTEANEDSTRVKDAIRERKYQYGLNLYYIRENEARLSIYDECDGMIRQSEYFYDKYSKTLNKTNIAQDWVKGNRKWTPIRNKNGL